MAPSRRGAERHLRALELPVVEAAAALVGCTITHGETGGVIVETEAYHEREPACHAFVGLTARTAPLFEAPGIAYVYRSYGIHALLNVVVEPAGVGAAVLIRALEPLRGEQLMRARRAPRDRVTDLCSGPGKLTQALGIDLKLNATPLLGGPIELGPPPPDRARRRRGSSPVRGSGSRAPWTCPGASARRAAGTCRGPGRPAC